MSTATTSNESRAAPPPEFRKMFEAELPWVLTTLRRLGVPPRDLADLAQEVFVTVHGLLDDYDDSRPVRPWLFTIAYRIARRHCARARHTREVSDATDAEAQYADATPLADARIESEQTKAAVRSALERIELPRRSVLILCDLEGLSVPDAATTLGIPLNTAYSRLRRAREELTAALSKLRTRRSS
jgi:RNA polymerase sigma-70 factor (ECF subfamily)